MGDAVDALDMNTAAPSSNLLLRQGKDDISIVKETQFFFHCHLSFSAMSGHCDNCDNVYATD